MSTRRDEDRDELPREVALEIARAQLSRLVVHPPHRPDDDIGYCHRCGVRRTRSEAAQVERDEACVYACVYACVVCGDTLDEAPF